MRIFVHFVLVGVFNTAMGYAIIFSLMYGLRFSPWLSNMIGYAVGLFISYILNRTFTFSSKSHPKSEFIRFVLVFLLAYTCNLMCLLFLIHLCNFNAGVSQILAGLVYILVSFGLNKFYVFAPRMTG